MKRWLILLLFMLIAAPSSFSQLGIWSGELEVMGNKIPLIFRLNEENPSVDSPTQAAKGIPIQFEKSENGEISISIPLIGANFVGKFESSKIVGTFSQNGFSFPLTLTPGEKKALRPQTPQPPFTYSQEEVSFSNGSAILKGTLTLPNNYTEATPVLLMVTGSGLQNRDEEIFEHKPFAVIADAFAKKGIASLRYDDRGFGESTGDAVNCSTEDLMKDALSGINLLRTRFKNVGVIGHSEGGTIALMLAADKKTDFIVSLAGMVVSGKELLIEQNRVALTSVGLPAESVTEYCRLLSLIFENNDSASEQLKNSELPADLKTNLYSVMQQAATPYMKYFLSLDVRERLREIACPVLALNGTKDVQVSSTPNLEALKNGLKNNNLNCIQSFDGLNHLFQHCDTGAISEYALIEETIAPEVLTFITDWILSLPVKLVP